MRRPKFSLRTLLLFVCLAGAGLGLWWRWEPWVEDKGIHPSFDSSIFSKKGWELPKKSPDGTRSIGHYVKWKADSPTSDIPAIEIVEAGGLILCELGKLDDAPRVYWWESDNRIIGMWRNENEPTKYYSQYWHRRRPEWWWGIAWLPEFWLTLMFGVGLVVSVVKDWKGLRA